MMPMYLTIYLSKQRLQKLQRLAESCDSRAIREAIYRLIDDAQ